MTTPNWRNRITRKAEESPEALTANPRNWRTHPKFQQDALAEILDLVGWVQDIIVNERTGNIVDGHLRVELAKARGEPTVPVNYIDVSEAEERLILATFDPITYLANRDAATLKELLKTIEAQGKVTLDMLLERLAGMNNHSANTLRERFLIPPFTILDSRQGYWQKRKNAWLSLGIQSGIGRDGMLSMEAASHMQNPLATGATKLSNSSIFDPVLAEIAYKWFSPKDGKILDPFAGGSVRGIVAAKLGYRYTGIDLRKEQVMANQEQWDGMSPPTERTTSDPEALTPIEDRGPWKIKRDDLFEINGVRGGKVRTCWALANKATPQGLVTAGSRQSPQVNIVAHIAQHLGIHSAAFIPEGEFSTEIGNAAHAGAAIHQVKAGYNNVIIARARQHAKDTGWTEIPFGMECVEAVTQTRKQAANIPKDTKRIVMACGSGMSLAGVLWGLKDQGIKAHVQAVVVGADPTDRLERFAPKDWRETTEIIQPEEDYHRPAARTNLEGLELDPIYEAKCLPYLRPGDLLWVVGIRQTEKTTAPHWLWGDSDKELAAVPPDQDLVFTCPPYYDLEEYSDDPRDLSNSGTYQQFLDIYREILAKACAKLKQNRFAVIIVGDIRDERGFYRGFITDTIKAMEDAGLKLYNEAIYIQQLGTLPVRAGRTFAKSRKLGKTHQNLLAFFKGDPGEADFGMLAEAAEMRRLQLAHQKLLVFAKGEPPELGESVEAGDPFDNNPPGET
jgi:DNA modification methylase